MRKQEVIDDFIDSCASFALRPSSIGIDEYRYYYNIRASWEEHIADLKMRDVITAKQSESLLEEHLPCKKDKVQSFRAKIEARMAERKEWNLKK